MSKRRAEFGSSVPFKRLNTTQYYTEQQYDPRLDQVIVNLNRIEERLDSLTKGCEDMYLKIAQIKRDTNQIQDDFIKKYNEIMRILEILCIKFNENTTITENLFDMETEKDHHDYFV